MRHLISLLFSVTLSVWVPNAHATLSGSGGHHGGGHNGGGHNGGGNNGGGDNGGNDQPPEQRNPDNDNNKWKWTVIPVPYLDFDFCKKIFIDDPLPLAPIGKIDEKGVGKLSDGKETQEIGTATRYRVIKYYSGDIGVGVAAVFHEVPATFTSFMPFVGLLPIGGRTAQIDRHVYGREAVDRVEYPSLHPRPEEVLSWENGDSVTYQSRGGLVFFGGAGAYGAGGVGSYHAEGSWTTRVEKGDEFSIVAKISRDKLRSFRVSAGSLITSISLSKFNGTDRDFSYRFDMRDSNAVLAYEDFVRGNFAMAQRLAGEKSGSVALEHVLHARRHGHSKSLFLGIPIFANRVSNSGKIYSQTETIDFENQGSKVDSKIDYAVYSFSTRKNLFFKHSLKIGSFIGAHYATRSFDGVTTGEVGRFVWDYETEKGTPRKLRRALRKISEITGVAVKLDLAADLGIHSEQDLGYVHVHFSMEIPEATTHYLMSLGSRGGLIESNGSLRDMSLAYRTQDWRGFTKAYASFGRTILQSPRTYQNFLSLTRGQAPVEMNLEVTGEKFSRVRRSL